MARPPEDLEPPTTPTPSDAGAHLEHTRATQRSVLWKLYLSHSLSTWNARTFEFAAVVFLAAIFPGTLFYTSCYALIRAFAAFVLSSAIGNQVDRKERLSVIRHSIVWQRLSVAASCGVLLLLLRADGDRGITLAGFVACVVLAGIEKLAFVGNTVAVERDWAVVVADGLGVPREDLNSAMRRIDLVGKLVAPLGVSLVDGYFSTEVAIWVVLGQNAASVVFVGHPWSYRSGIKEPSADAQHCRNTSPSPKSTPPSPPSQPAPSSPLQRTHHPPPSTPTSTLGSPTSAPQPSSPPSPSPSSTSQSSASAPN